MVVDAIYIVLWHDLGEASEVGGVLVDEAEVLELVEQDRARRGRRRVHAIEVQRWIHQDGSYARDEAWPPFEPPPAAP